MRILSTKPLMPLMTMALFSAGTAQADLKVHFPMELSGAKVTEAVSGQKFDLNYAVNPETAYGAQGSAVRFDGYSNYIEGQINAGDLKTFTFSLWCAMETYPIIQHDVQNTTEYTCIAGNYNEETKSGFGFFINRVGRISFRYYSGGWPAEATSQVFLPLYQWNNLVAVGNGSKVFIYNNGELIAQANCKGINADGTFFIGKSAKDSKMGGLFHLNTVNGIIDEIELHDVALDVEEFKNAQAQYELDLNSTDEGYFHDDLWRPTFHGMPSRNWTNESHGIVYYNDQYHVFFQKNANGPYMSRLQWGHIVSDNLIHWEEMPIAVGSDMWYDEKGCWSGCIMIDDELTGGKPNLVYTGVDYARAMISQAAPEDEELLTWTKPANNPIINGRPGGLSDDFRDPYFFSANGDKYIIVGSSKDNKGVCTLHKYNPATRQWSNDGNTFFQAANATTQGRFWEMPTVTNFDGKWMFTATPLDLNGGVKVLYWTGDITADGKFSTQATPQTVELPGFAKEGYGMLSPTILQHDGKTIALGIVPDKLPSQINYQMGWAHLYSLPREWSLSESGQLIQKPYSGLEAMRSDVMQKLTINDLNGEKSLGDMTDRQVELIGEFTVGDADFGFNLFQNGSRAARLYYSPKNAKLVLDLGQLERISNDAGVFNGLYETSLPQAITKGSTMKLHVFVDRSIIDIFVNDMWASSVRVFPTDTNANGVGVFSEGGATQTKAYAWNIDSDLTGIDDIIIDNAGGENVPVDVYNMSGVKLRSGVQASKALEGMPAGMYIVGNKKILVR